MRVDDVASSGDDVVDGRCTVVAFAAAAAAASGADDEDDADWEFAVPNVHGYAASDHGHEGFPSNGPSYRYDENVVPADVPRDDLENIAAAAAVAAGVADDGAGSPFGLVLRPAASARDCAMDVAVCENGFLSHAAAAVADVAVVGAAAAAAVDGADDVVLAVTLTQAIGQTALSIVDEYRNWYVVWKPFHSLAAAVATAVAASAVVRSYCCYCPSFLDCLKCSLDCCKHQQCCPYLHRFLRLGIPSSSCSHSTCPESAHYIVYNWALTPLKQFTSIKKQQNFLT